MQKQEILAKIDKIKTKLKDYWHLLFKSAHHNFYRLESCKQDASGQIRCEISFESYLELKKFQKKLRRMTFGTTSLIAIIVAVNLVFGFINREGQETLAASYSFQQTSWVSGASVMLADHASNQSGWDYYTSKDAGISATTEISLESFTASRTQTDDSATETGFNMTGKSFTDTLIVNSDNEASINLTSGPVNSPWSRVADIPAAVNGGVSLVHPESSNYIYALRGGSTNNFYRYSIASVNGDTVDTWTTMASAPAAIADGGSLVYPGSGNYIYAFRGGLNSTAFYRYSIASVNGDTANTWTTMAPAPGYIRYGGDLVYPGSGNYLYAFAGNGSAAFYRYSIASINSDTADTWTTMTSAPSVISSGGALVYPGSGNYIYGSAGSGSAFYRYSIASINGDTADTWATMTSLPSNITLGATLVYPGSGNYIYASAGGNTTILYRYSIASIGGDTANTWTPITSLVEIVNNASDMTGDGSGEYIYYAKGGSTSFFRYRVANTYSWTTAASAPAVVGGGAALVHPESSNYVYALQGGSTANFYRYSIASVNGDTADTWTTMTSAPNAISSGGALVYPGSGNYIYALRGGYSNVFYRYSIASINGDTADTWTTMTALPGGVGEGGSLVYPGSGNYIYALRGGSTANFYRYSIASINGDTANTWTTMTSAPGNTRYGAGLVYPGSGNYIYASQGSTGKGLYRYSIASVNGDTADTWTTMATAPLVFGSGGSMVYPGSGNYIYITCSTAGALYRYSISSINGDTADTWTPIASLPGGAIADGGALVYPGSGAYIYGFSGGNANFSRFQTNAYTASGSYASGIIDTGQKNQAWGNLNYTADVPASTALDVKVRSCALSDCSGATSFATTTNGAAMSAGVSKGHRYIQYEVLLNTADTTISPSLNDITLGYSAYATTTKTIISSKYDSSDFANIIGQISWTEDSAATPITGTTKTISLRTASTSALLDSALWNDFASGTPASCTKTGAQVTCANDAIPSDLRIGNNDRFFQYKVTLTSDGENTQSLKDINLVYVVNATPEVTVTSVEQVTSDTAVGGVTAEVGEVAVHYQVRDYDTTTGSTQESVLISLQYWDVSGAQWITATTTSLKGDFGSGISVNADGLTYTNHSLVWNPNIEYDEKYYLASAGFKIRLIANDSEMANNLGYGQSETFDIDTKKPTADNNPATYTAVKIDARKTTAALQDKADITVKSADDSIVAFRYSLSSTTASDLIIPDGINNDAAFGSGVWITDPSIKTSGYTLEIALNPVSSTLKQDTVYVQFKDAYNNVNTAIYSVDTPEKPSATMVQDVSNMIAVPSEAGLFIAWKKTGLTSGTNQGQFKHYVIARSATYDGVYTPLGAPITDKNANFYRDSDLATDSNYYYRIYVEDGIGNMSYYSTAYGTNEPYVHAIPNGIQDAGEGGGGVATPIAHPIISNASSTAISTSQATITWDTDLISDSKVRLMTNNSGDFSDAAIIGISTFADNAAGIGSHAVVLSGLQPSTTYYFEVESVTPNNVNATSSGYSFQTLSGPIVTPSSVVMENLSNTGIDVKWSTDLEASSYVIYSSNLNFNPSIQFGSDTPTSSHEVHLSDLAIGTDYYFYVKSDTASDNNAGEYYSFRTTSDIEAPIISNIATSSKRTQAFISWETDEDASSEIHYGLSTAYTNISSSSIMTKVHLLEMSALNIGSEYHYIIVSRDANGNTSTSSDNVISTEKFRLYDVEATTVSETEINIGWKTDEDAASELVYSTNPDLSSGQNVVASGEPTKNHELSLSGLIEKTKYYYRASSSAFGLTVNSPLYSFTTGDKEAPTISNITIDSISADHAIIRWSTNEVADSLVEYDVNSDPSYILSASSTLQDSSHNIRLDDLIASTTYYFRITSKDGNGNASSSLQMSFTTLVPPEAHIPLADPGDPVIAQKSDTKAVITLSAGSQSSAKLCYSTSTLSNVETDICLQSKNSNDLVKFHTFFLEDLMPDTTYYLKAKVNDSEDAGIFFYRPNDPDGSIEMKTMEKLYEENAVDALILEAVEDALAEAAAAAARENAPAPIVIDRTDSQAPIISSVKVSKVADTSATITWQTDEDSISAILYGLSDDYLVSDADPSSLRKKKTKHSLTLHNLTPETTYHFAATAIDGWGNTAIDKDTTFTTSADDDKEDVIDKKNEESLKQIKKLVIDLLASGKVNEETIRNAISQAGEPPMISGNGPMVSSITSDSAIIDWETNRNSNSVIIYYPENIGSKSAQQSGDFSSFTTSHSIKLNGLMPGTTYVYKAQSTDALGNSGSSKLLNFKTDTIPYISKVIIGKLTNNSVEIYWQSNIESSTGIDYGSDTKYGQSLEANDGAQTLSHKIKLSKLKNGETYHFRIKGKSRSNEVVYSDDYSFTTLLNPDMLSYDLLEVGDKKTTISWKTNVRTTSEISYTNTNTKTNKVISKDNFDKTHKIELTDLEPKTKYTFIIKGKDENNQTLESSEFSFITLVDSKAPVIDYVQTDMAMISKGDNAKVQAVITWKTNEPSSTELIYTSGAAKNLSIDEKGTGSGENKNAKVFEGESGSVTKHIVVLNDLTQGTVYTFKARSIDESGNASYSKEYTILTPAKEESVLQVIIKTFEDTFGWLNLNK